ncbi:hypothetical protein LS482_17945 [Sinomicrobium kalidii]|uniref:hypothetical protein n=1 Tax=Sinomicrobium kalidii TaxID=2900738 RepID=UPI001E320955|nr:hypothetical protein [Sinomicrobium kalidii]UGU15550.1 hypothetical protein LS482_17945 [Sinomicrobium kalidii]
MTTLITVITFLGFYALYHTSKRALLFRSFKVEQWMQANRKRAGAGGLSLLAAALVLSVVHYGFGAGIFAFFVILMTLGSLVVILAPLRFVGYRALLLIVALAITFEFL